MLLLATAGTALPGSADGSRTVEAEPDLALDTNTYAGPQQQLFFNYDNEMEAPGRGEQKEVSSFRLDTAQALL